ncbi:MAG: 3'-5' exonuclease, partial [Rikenellaceae bacterium]
GNAVNSAFYGTTIKEENLTRNFRSRREIINFNNHLIRECVRGLNTTLNSSLDKLRDEDKITNETVNLYRNILEHAYEEMEQEYPDNGKNGGYIEVIKYDEKKNLWETIRIIKELQDRGYEARDIAILVRNKKAAREITAFILEYKRNNPEECEKYCFDIIASDGLALNRSNVIKFIMSVYSLTEKASATALAIYNRYLSRELTTPIPENERAFMTTLHHSPATVSFEQITEQYSLGENPNNIAYLQAFHTAIIKFSGTEIADAASLLEWWKAESENLSVALPEGQNAISIETIHKSKGLQYNVVIIPFCNWGLAPSSRENYFWAKSTDERIVLPESSDQKIIISYKKALEDSYFCTSYVKEQILTYVENFNIFYVALTRAVSELYLMIPSGNRGNSGINNYIETAIGETLIYGEKQIIKPNTHQQSEIEIRKFNHSELSSRLALHTESDKFFQDMEEEGGNVDARGKGILLHKLFEETTNLENLPQNIDKLLATGYISKAEADTLKTTCCEALSNPVISEWFSDQWETRSESAILLPTIDGEIQLSTKRPDRVLIRGESAIVIDYKFGSVRPSHRKQIAQYKELLQSMGYKEIKGYLWYINNNLVVNI